MEKRRYYNQNIGTSKQNEQRALEIALALSAEIENINRITVLIPTQHNTDFLSRIFDEKLVKRMLAQPVKVLDDYPPLKIETIKSIDDYGNQDRILLAYGLQSDRLLQYDSHHSYRAIIAHQWNAGELNRWAENWGARDMDTHQPATPIPFPPQVVKNALLDLSKSVNKDKIALHPFDEELCKTYLRILFKDGQPLVADQLYAFLTRDQNWNSSLAGQIYDWAEKLNLGKRFTGGKISEARRHLERWKREA
jgi:hypothetical protein